MGSGQTIEDRLHAFYHSRLEGVGCYAELRRFAKARHAGSLDFLKATLADLLPEASAETANDAFPKTVTIGGSTLPLRYRHEPGGDADGVTLQVPISQFGAIREGVLDWAVPGHLEAKIESLLRGLPKPIRVSLHPLKERAAHISRHLQASDRPLRELLSEYLLAEYRIRTHREDWSRTQLPDYLKPRIQVQQGGEVLAAGRDIDALHAQLRDAEQAVRQGDGLDRIPAGQQAAARYEREQIREWNFGDLPEAIDLSGEAGLPLKAYPALVAEHGSIHLRLMPDRAGAQAATADAWPALGEQLLARELGWLQRDLKDLKQLGPLLLPLGNTEAVKHAAWQLLRRHLFRCESLPPLRQARFDKVLQRADQERRGIVPQLLDRLRALLETRLQIELLLQQKQTKQAISFPGMRAQMESLAPADLLQRYELNDLPHLTRFLKGMLLRAERAKSNIQGDIEKSQRIAPFERTLATLRERCTAAELKPFRILLEEFKISVFAQELGTAQKVSEKRLQQLAEQLARG